MTNIEKLQHQMVGGLEAALIADDANRFYLTGMKSSAGALLITRNSAVFLIDFRYFEEAQRKVSACTVMEAVSLHEQIRQLLQKARIGRLSVVASAMCVAECRQWQAALPDIVIDDSDALAQTMEAIRRHKDSGEIENLRRAQNITDRAFTHILDIIRPGITELDIARELGYTMEKLGSDDRHYHYIVASGPNSSLPHGFATDRAVQYGDFITMDFGAVAGGYFADMTRTVGVGSITEEQRRIYEVVREAQNRAFELIQTNAFCNQIDAAAREYIYSQGYKGCFSHGLGHSVGIDVHENPRFNESCTDILEPGIVMTVEPGIYMKGRFGVRIEDMIVVQKDGFENLTASPKELIIL